MRRVIAIQNSDGTLYLFPDGTPVTFATVSAARRWLAPGQTMKPIDVAEDHTDAFVSDPL